MELDLNQEPWNQIEERIRRLEAVIFRARQRQRWRQGHTPIQTTNFAGELIRTANVQDDGRVHQEEVGIDVEGGTADCGRIRKRKATYLIAKALGMETSSNEAEGCTGNFFDCNICLYMARDPVLTCCGHLFCWPCFYQLSCAYLNTKECPVCEGEVTETGIIPIYGNASVNSSDQLELKESGFRIPSRPRAPRVESIRQQIRNRGASSTIQDMMWHGNFFDGSGERVQMEIPNTATNRTNVLVTQSRQEIENNQHASSHQFSGLLPQGAASFSSLSSAINSAERLSEELYSYMHGPPIGSIIQHLYPHTVNRDSLFSIASTNQSESHSRDVAATNSASTSSVSSSSRDDDINALTDSAASSSVFSLSTNDDIDAVSDSNNQPTDSRMQTISSDPSSSSRTDVLRRVPNEP